MVTREEGWEGGIVREFRIDMYTLLYLKWITNKDLLYSKPKNNKKKMAYEKMFHPQHLLLRISN